jgi:hypothetical protein
MLMPAIKETVRVAPCAADEWRIDRRDFLKTSAASLFGLMLGSRRLGAAPQPSAAGLRFGLLTDAHYADTESKGTRFYRESLGKVREAVGRLRAERVAFLAELGDFKDMAPGEPEARTLAHLVAVEREFQRFGGPTCHVLGNHDLDNLSKAQVLAHVTNIGVAAGRSYYAFSQGGIRFIVLDTNFTADGRDYDHGRFDWRDAVLPPVELDWLCAELAAAAEPAIVFGHQRLDGDGNVQVINRAEIRGVLERSGKVLAVFQGHDHAGAYTLIRGIHYYTLKAIIEGSGPENNAYAAVDVHPDLGLTVTGYRRALSRELVRGASAPSQPSPT